MAPFAGPDIEVSPQQAQEIVAAGGQLVDVREDHEWDAGHVAGSVHIGLAQLTAQAGTLDKERPVVFVCRVGARSAMAAQALSAAGFEAHSLAGGLMAWHAAGLPLVPDGGTVADH